MIELLVFLSIIGFLQMVIYIQKIKPNTLGEKMYTDYIFYCNNPIIWSLYYIKYLFLGLFIFFNYQVFDIIVFTLLFFDLLNFKTFKIPVKLPYFDFLDMKIKLILDNSLIKSQDIDFKKELFNEYNNQKGFFLLFNRELIFIIIFIISIYKYF